MKAFFIQLCALHKARKLSKIDVEPKRVFFYNIWGKYNDNTKALAEAYHRIHPEYELIYAVAPNTNTAEIPQYIRTTISGTEECQSLMYSSKIVIDNDWGAIKKSGRSIKGKIACALYAHTVSTNILYVSTGHGTPLKRIGTDSVSNKVDSFVTSTNFMCVPDAHSMNVYKRITMGAVTDFFLTGQPRNDVLYDSDYRLQIKNKLKLGGKHLLLFAPTFRTRIVDGRVVFIGVEELLKDIACRADEIVYSLQNKFGGEWVIGLRIHPGATKNMGAVFNSNIIDANVLTDIADYLCVTDFLVTDYSSCFFDYMLTKRPGILLWTDEQEYVNKESGLYFQREELPYPVADSFHDLIKKIAEFDPNTVENDITKFMDHYQFTDKPQASESVIRHIDNRLLQGV